MFKVMTDEFALLEIPDFTATQIREWIAMQNLHVNHITDVQKQYSVWWTWGDGVMYILVHGSWTGQKVVFDGKVETVPEFMTHFDLSNIKEVQIISCNGGNLPYLNFHGIDIHSFHNSPFPVYITVEDIEMFDEYGHSVGSVPCLQLDFYSKELFSAPWRWFMRMFRRFTNWVESWHPKKVEVIG